LLNCLPVSGRNYPVKKNNCNRRKFRKNTLLKGAVFAAGTFLAACGGGGGGGTNGAINPGLTTLDQSLDLTRQISVSSAGVPSEAWLVIYEDNGGVPAATTVAIKGLAPASYSDLKVGLDRPAIHGELFHAILHDDLGAVGTWEPGIDTPMLDDMSSPVADSLVVSVSVGTPDVRLTVSNVGDIDYRWIAVEPGIVTGVVTVGTRDPILTLFLDERYEIVNLARSDHPFELMTAGSTQTLLSEEVAGTLEADVGIDWTDNGSGIIRFTATATLDASLGAYRCFEHPVDMLGTAGIQ